MANTKTTVQLYLGKLDPALKDQLNREAAEREASVNDVLVEILARHFKVKFIGTGRRGPGVRGGTTDSYRIPIRLDAKLNHTKSMTRTSKHKLVEQALTDHFAAAEAAA